jgi:class 3 adenylate cyclase
MKITETAFAREGVLGPGGLAACKFLVIDDSRMIRLTISKHLRQIGFESIDEADNGAAAIDLLRTGKDYDLVLLDLEMPGMDGFEFLKIVKSDPALRSVPVIVVSASEQLSAAIQCISDGAEDFLNKPFDPVLLRARVFSSIEKKRLRDNDRQLLRELENEKSLLQQEKEKSEQLLLNVLPQAIAARLKNGEKVIAEKQEATTVGFTDLVGFTPYARNAEPVDVVTMLNRIFSNFDIMSAQNGVEKIKTIGDCYMFAAGGPVPVEDHARRVADSALEMVRFIERFNARFGTAFQIRIGLNSGPLVAGIIGKQKFAYDIWGDAVNVASRMESSGLPGRIHISESTRAALGSDYECEPRGTIECKGLGQINTYFLLSKNDPFFDEVPVI